MHTKKETPKCESVAENGTKNMSDKRRVRETILRGVIAAAIAGAALVPGSVYAQNQYAGAQACAPCHSTQSAAGRQDDPFHAWQKSKHSGAWQTLAKDSAGKETRRVEGLWIVAMGRGEKYGLPVPAAEFPHCLFCHATAATVDPKLVAGTLDRKEGVQCESCHGPASAHVRVETLKRSGKAIPAEDVAAALDIAKAVTLKRFSNENEIEAQCRTCHDGMCGDFDFQKAWPSIRH